MGEAGARLMAAIVFSSAHLKSAHSTHDPELRQRGGGDSRSPCPPNSLYTL